MRMVSSRVPSGVDDGGEWSVGGDLFEDVGQGLLVGDVAGGDGDVVGAELGEVGGEFGGAGGVGAAS